jgi:hypothetical protein
MSDAPTPEVNAPKAVSIGPVILLGWLADNTSEFGGWASAARAGEGGSPTRACLGRRFFTYEQRCQVTQPDLPGH